MGDRKFRWALRKKRPMADDPGAALVKDLAEQLRTIQFALLALCLGTIVLLSATDPSELERAEGQAEMVFAFSAAWAHGQGLVACAVKAIPKLKSTQIPIGESVFNVVDVKLDNTYPGHNLNVMLSFVLPRLGSPIPEAAAKAGGYLDEPTDLEQIAKLFDALKDVDVAYVTYPHPIEPYDHGAVYDTHDSFVDSFAIPTFVSKADDMSLDVHMRDTAEGRETKEYEMDLLRFKADYPVEKASLEGLGCFPSLSRVSHERLQGSFKSAFPELTATAADLQHVRLDDLRAVLHKLRKTSSIEVFGTKVEGVSASAIALVSMLVVQIYFAIHFLELRRLLATSGPRPPVAWFGLYSDKAARALFVAAQILPLALVALLAYRLFSDSETSRLPLALLLVLAIVGMAALVAVVLRRPLSER